MRRTGRTSHVGPERHLGPGDSGDIAIRFYDGEGLRVTGGPGFPRRFRNTASSLRHRCAATVDQSSSSRIAAIN